MIDVNILKLYREKADIYEETEKLKDYFNKIKKTRIPFLLDLEDFEKILKWKLTGQYFRQKKIRDEKIKEEHIKKITSLALNISHEDKDYELELRINILRIIPGVGIGVASAILALCFPEKYAVIDYRGWRQIFSEEKRNFSLNEYKKYLREIKKLADELEWSPQEVDLAIWAYDKESI